MAEYGVQPAGFVSKRLPDLLAEIEAAAIATFGPGVIQTAQSPLGQLNGLYASLSAKLWEMAEEVYSANDPDQAEENNLTRLARFRLLARDNIASIPDAEFRRLITNSDRANIDIQDIAAALRTVPGVTWANVIANETTDSVRGQPARTIAAAVIGGADADVANVLRRYVTPGVVTWGNTRVETVVDGYCRTLLLIRPVVIEISLAVVVKPVSTSRACQPPPPDVVAAAIADGLTGLHRPVNGEAPTIDHVRAAMAGLPGVAISTIAGVYGADETIPLTSIVEIDPSRVTVTYTP